MAKEKMSGDYRLDDSQNSCITAYYVSCRIGKTGFIRVSTTIDLPSDT